MMKKAGGEPLLQENNGQGGSRVSGNSAVVTTTMDDPSAVAAGLSTREARDRLLRDGYNELAEDTQNPCLKFLSYYWGPMPIMIWIAIAVELAEACQNSQHWLDFGVLMLLQLVNGFVGWYEERNAGNAIAALKKELALVANVKRDGVWQQLPARELVQGD